MSACSVLEEASIYLCAAGVPHRAVIGSAADPAMLLSTLRSAGINDFEVSATKGCAFFLEYYLVCIAIGIEMSISLGPDLHSWYLYCCGAQCHLAHEFF